MSKNRVKNHLLIFAVLVFFGACNLDSIDEPIIVAEVKKEFNLDLWEELRTDSRVLQLVIETIEDENCTNYTIDYAYTLGNSKLNISIQEIVPPDDCNEGEAPASSVADLGRLAPDFYELNIDLKNTVFSKGQLSIYNDRYKVNMDTEEGIIFLRRELLRVPPQTIWGYIGFQDSADEMIANDFIADVEALGTKQTYNSGYYGYFNITSEGKVNMDYAFTPEKVKTFILEYSGEDSELQNLANTYRSTYGDAIELKIFTHQGKEY